MFFLSHRSAFFLSHRSDQRPPAFLKPAPDAAAVQAKYISHDMPMAPVSLLGDGLMDLFFVKKGAGRVAMITVRRCALHCLNG